MEDVSPTCHRFVLNDNKNRGNYLLKLNAIGIKFKSSKYDEIET